MAYFIKVEGLAATIKINRDEVISAHLLNCEPKQLIIKMKNNNDFVFTDGPEIPNVKIIFDRI